MLMSDQNMLGSIYGKIDHNEIRRTFMVGGSQKEIQASRVS